MSFAPLIWKGLDITDKGNQQIFLGQLSDLLTFILSPSFVTSQTAANPLVPAGCIVDYAGVTAPAGWLLCDGTSYATATYPGLSAAIGYTYGGSGANFNVPDCRGRTGIGAGSGSGLTTRVLAASGGEEYHALSIAELAAHNHTDAGHTHPTSAFAEGDITATAGAYKVVVFASWNTGTGNTSINNTGSNTPHNTMQPFIVLNKIIKT